MKTLDLESAASFLHMSPSALRHKAKSGQIKAAKPGKRWVFLETDLVNHLKSLYQKPVEAHLISIKENALCQSTDVAKHGGLTSPHQMDKEYADLLGLKKESRL